MRHMNGYLERGLMLSVPRTAEPPVDNDWVERMRFAAHTEVAPFGNGGATWNFPDSLVTTKGAALTSLIWRKDSGQSPEQAVAEPADQSGVAYLPPFARVQLDARGGVSGSVDWLGFRHVFVREAPGATLLSTSARALHHASPDPGFDEGTLALQSQLGWQLDGATLFSGVRKLEGSFRITADGTVHESPPPALEQVGPADSAREAAALLRRIVSAYLEEVPEAELQLTGGIDSRIILAAIPPSQRRGLRSMTLRVPSGLDAPLAARIANREGLRHREKDFSAIDELSPQEAHDTCIVAARRVDSAADPIALAAVDLAEGGDPSPRLVGLGGEVGRGFYYFGPGWLDRNTAGRVRRLAQWRLFANESVPDSMLSPEFSAWARDEALRRTQVAFRESATGWANATDHFYLRQRMRRWAGSLASTPAVERQAFNPMLDARYLALVTSLPPAEKRNSRFLARLMCELDPELARLPMDGRPAPAAFASRSLSSRFQQVAARAPKLAKKVRQRITRSALPPEGGSVLAAKLVEHWRESPEVLQPLASLPYIDSRWMEDLVSGRRQPSVSACSLMVSLLAV